MTTTTLAQQLQALHARTTKGTWGRGETSHHIASNKGAGKHYRVAEFRHADDAEFCEFVHANMPAILEALGALEMPLHQGLKTDAAWQVETLHRMLDRLGVDRCDSEDFYSLWGRVSLAFATLAKLQITIPLVGPATCTPVSAGDTTK